MTEAKMKALGIRLSTYSLTIFAALGLLNLVQESRTLMMLSIVLIATVLAIANSKKWYGVSWGAAGGICLGVAFILLDGTSLEERETRAIVFMTIIFCGGVACILPLSNRAP